MTQILSIEECLTFKNLRKWIFGMLERITCKGAKRFELADNVHPALQGRSVALPPRFRGKCKPCRPEQDRQEHSDSRVVAVIQLGHDAEKRTDLLRRRSERSFQLAEL